MGVAAFSVFALYSWWKFLKNPSWIKFSIAFLLQACLHLSKFSSPLFLPVIGIMAIMAIFAYQQKWSLGKRVKIYIGATVLATILAYIIVGIWYQASSYKMPLAVQQQLIEESVFDTNFKNAGLATKFIKITEIPVLRPYVQYLLGFIMVATHASYGHSTYFMGEIGQNWSEYYFIAYLLKEPLASQVFLYLSGLILAGIVFKFLKSNSKKKDFQEAFKKYNIFIAFNALIIIYLILGMMAKLQLGIRYIIPVFFYLYIMIGGLIAYQINQFKKINQSLYRFSLGLIIILMAWLALVNFKTYPHYLAYFNETIGGPENGWEYLIDSNIDWGQDLRRLKSYADTNNIQDIKIDYFGGGDLDYYFGQGNYELWGFDREPTTGWLAISVNAIQWNSANDEEKQSYHWLTDKYEPVEKIGYSIFVYHIPEESKEEIR